MQSKPRLLYNDHTKNLLAPPAGGYDVPSFTSISSHTAHKGSSLPPAWSSNVAQGGDIFTLLLVLKMLVECGVQKIHLFGHSRGGGTILTTLGRLYWIHQQSLAQFGISNADAAKIRAAVDRGSIVLNCPLVDTPQIIQDKL